MKNLDFAPETPWNPGLPPLNWRDIRICGFESDLTGQEIGCDLEVAFKQVYPSLSFAELSRLFSKAQEISSHIPVGTIFKAYGYFLDNQTEEVIQVFLQTNFSFQKWCQLKKIQPKELLPLTALTDLNSITTWLSKFENFNFSHSEGVKLLEWLVDLELTDKLPETPSTWNSASFNFIKGLRYPVSTELEVKASSFWQSLPWPKGISAKGVRTGDNYNLEVKFSITNQKDFANKIKQQERVLANWMSNELEH